MPYSEIFREFSGIVKTHQSKTAVFFKQNSEFISITYQALYSRAVRLGNFLSDKGAKNGDNIVLLLGNQPEWPIAFMAVQSIGSQAVPIDINLTPSDIRQLVIHCRAKIILCSEKLYNNIQEGLSGIQGLEIFQADSTEFLKKVEGFSEELKSEGGVLPSDRIAAMFYTSGTTNLPKGVMLSQKNLLSNVQSLKSLDIVREDDVFISFLPLHHTYSFMVTCLIPLLQGAQVSYPKSLTSEDLLNCLQETKVTVLTGVPQIFMLFHQKIKTKLKELPLVKRFVSGILVESCWAIRKYFGLNLSKRLLHKMHQPFGGHLRFMVTGGARLEPNVTLDFFKWGFTLLEGYGLTETSPIVTLNHPDKPKIGSVGSQIPDVRVGIVNADEKGVGEVIINGPNLMLGYYQMPVETGNVIQNGWFFTGDLGYLDKDKYLYIKGRKDEMIALSSGKKINPEEIEKSYASVYIKEICVFAQKASGMIESASQIMAVIVPNEEYFRAHELVNIEEKIKWEIENISHRLSSYKRIKGFVISKEGFPRTRLGKLMRNKIGEIYSKKLSSVKKEGASAEGDDLILQSESCRKLLEYLSTRLKRKVNLDDHLELDLGFDSLGRIELFLELKELFDIEIPESAMMDFFYAYTIRELIHKVRPYIPQSDLKQLKKDEAFWAKVLGQQPDAKTFDMIRLKPLTSDKILTFLFNGFFRLLFAALFRFEVKNQGNLPEKGPYILYANHTSYLDGFLIAASLPFKIAINSYFLGLSAYFTHPLVKSLNKPGRLIPIDATFDLVKNLQVCAYIIKNSKILCYFPEGQRAPSIEGIPFKKGIGILAKELNVPLIPVYIDGAFQAWPRFAKFPRPAKIKIIIGEKVTYSNQDDYEIIATGLRDKLQMLGKNV